jgi:hypothetical protein
LEAAIIAGLLAGVLGSLLGIWAAWMYLVRLSGEEYLDDASERGTRPHLPRSVAKGSTVGWIASALVATPIAGCSVPAHGYVVVIASQLVFLALALRLTRSREHDRH